MKPLNEFFKDAKNTESPVVDAVLTVFERSSTNEVSYSEGVLRFYSSGKPSLGSFPLFYSEQPSTVRMFLNDDRYTNSMTGQLCPFNGNVPFAKALKLEVMIAELTNPKVKPSIHYSVRISGLVQSSAVEFQPTYEPNSKILTGVAKGTSDYKFVTISLCNMRKAPII